jgi:hypothetical protein
VVLTTKVMGVTVGDGVGVREVRWVVRMGGKHGGGLFFWRGDSSFWRPLFSPFDQIGCTEMSAPRSISQTKSTEPF